MPFFRAPRASTAMPRAHANSAASEKPSALSVGCSQPVFGRREHFHVLRLFNGLQAGKFPLPSFEDAPARRWRRRGRMRVLRRAKSLRALVWLLPAPPRPSKISTFRAFSMRCRQENSRPLFGTATPRRHVRRSAGRAAVFASSCAPRGQRRRRPKIACSRRECATSVRPPTSLATGQRRPTAVGGGGRGSRRSVSA